ncbi:MAG: acetyl-CoA hydrolase/transferase C-terminal domain-containing protein [Syntrophomonadaceae bacterium]|nr:acetyl-CoA hydrolase/transferase C-terminal domain-containing protein [Syntrophomonadaceae bacterium]
MTINSVTEAYRRKCISFEEAAGLVKDNEFISTALGATGVSPEFYEALLDRCEEVRGVKIMDSLQLKPSRLYDPAFMKPIEEHILFTPTFGAARVREAYKANCDFIPNNVLDGGAMMANRATYHIFQVTPPNSKGYLNLGLTNDYTLQSVKEGIALGKTRLVVGEVNEQMPVVFGDNWLHISEFDYFIENSSEPVEFKRAETSVVEETIAHYVLELIEDGDTIQMGIGGIPEAVASGLRGKHHLGIHSEMFPLGLPRMIEEGIVDNTRKPVHQGISISTFCLGDKSMYDFVAENPACQIYPAVHTNWPALIAQHEGMVAMNMALQIDLSGQITAEGLGHRMISGAGGQLDFAMGAYWSKRGKPITLLRAARKGANGELISAILPELPLGSPVTVPRTFACYIITEYGVADLRYKTRRERAQELISIAHPELRDELRFHMRKNFY